MKDLITELEELSRKGDQAAVQRVLSELPVKKVLRQHCAPLANIAWRSGLPAQGLRLLNDIIKEERLHNPTADEISEYAVCLLNIGIIDEAINRLERIPQPLAAEYPKVDLYLSYCFINKWNYSRASEHLLKYLDQADKQDYQTLVAKLNLAACYVSMRQYDVAAKWIESLLETTDEKNHRRIRGNMYELYSQVCYFQQNYGKMQKYLNLSKELIGTDASIYQLYITKWQTILDARLKNDVHLLIDLQNQVDAYEVKRDLDFHRLTLQPDQSVFEKLYFGTPFDSYRKTLIEVFSGMDLPNQITYGDERNILDIERPGLVGISEGGVVHLLLKSLSKDLYRPARVGSLFSAIYPGDYYDFHSSANRVAQVIFRLRTGLRNSGYSIEKIDDGFFLQLKNQHGLRLHRNSEVSSRFDYRMRELELVFSGRKFNSAMVREYFSISSSATNLILAEALKKGLLERQGKGRSTTYTFQESKNPVPFRDMERD